MTRCAASEYLDVGVTFTTINMPLVTHADDCADQDLPNVPTLAPEEAADLIVQAIVYNRCGSRAARRVRTGAARLAPRVAQIVMNTTFRMFPDSDASKAPKEGEKTATADQIAYANLMRGSLLRAIVAAPAPIASGSTIGDTLSAAAWLTLCGAAAPQRRSTSAQLEDSPVIAKCPIFSNQLPARTPDLRFSRHDKIVVLARTADEFDGSSLSARRRRIAGAPHLPAVAPCAKRANTVRDAEDVDRDNACHCIIALRTQIGRAPPVRPCCGNERDALGAGGSA